MNEQHTPGPWEWDTSPVNYDPEQDAPWLVSMETAKFPDCAILTGQIKCYREQDARLIAAAPCLLEALRPFAAGNFTSEAVKQARAAIARALPQGARDAN